MEIELLFAVVETLTELQVWMEQIHSRIELLSTQIGNRLAIMKKHFPGRSADLVLRLRSGQEECRTLEDKVDDFFSRSVDEFQPSTISNRQEGGLSILTRYQEEWNRLALEFQWLPALE